jgi:hypothetical protein
VAVTGINDARHPGSAGSALADSINPIACRRVKDLGMGHNV